MADRRQFLAAAFAPNPHERWMRRAIELAANNTKYPFAALLVDRARGVVVAEGWNRSGANPIVHGEIDAINQGAARKADWARVTLYTTAEPCAMCQAAALWAGIEAVVYGTSIPFLQSLGLTQIDIRAAEVVRRTDFRKCTVTGGVLEAECNALFVAAKKQW